MSRRASVVSEVSDCAFGATSVCGSGGLSSPASVFTAEVSEIAGSSPSSCEASRATSATLIAPKPAADVAGLELNPLKASFHTLPNPRTPVELWPDLSKEEEAKLAEHQERMARQNPGYSRLDGDDCGRRALAGKSVAVPFVGTSAASFVVAEAVRLMHDGPAFLDIKLGLGNPAKRFTRRNGNYTAQDTAGLTFVPAKKV